MGKKGGARHLKRKSAPGFWPIHRKERMWTFKPHPGPHPADSCLPLSLAVRDTLGYARNAREAEIIISQGKVKVDGKIRRDRKYPAGLMDVVELPDAGISYRVLPVAGKGLRLVKITKDEAKFKLCRIEDKTSIRRGTVQLNLHDGRNLLLLSPKEVAPAEPAYSTRDTLKIGLPGQRVLGHHKLAVGMYALVTGGRNQGLHGKIKEVIEGSATRPPIVVIEGPDGQTMRTISNYVFVVGDDKPAIRLEAAA